MNLIKSKLALLLLAGGVLNSIYAQEGYSSASLHWGKMNATEKRKAVQNGLDYFTYAVPKPEDVVVEEYFNYHHHNISFPDENQSIALDLQWGNDFVNATNNSAILQIGIATSELNKGSLADAPPVNVSLVIDKSGSMGSDNRLINAKEAASILSNAGMVLHHDIKSNLAYWMPQAIHNAATPHIGKGAIEKLLKKLQGFSIITYEKINQYLDSIKKIL